MKRPPQPLRDDDRPIVMPWFDPRPRRQSPETGISANPSVCIRINYEWLPFILGIISALDEPDSWAGTQEQIDYARSQIRQLIASLGECEGSDDMEMRQSPENSCHLEYRSDATGGLWELAFDYSLCKSANDGYSYGDIVEIEKQIDDDVAEYQDDPGAYAPELNVPSADTNAALCLAIKAFIEAVCVSSIQAVNDKKANRASDIRNLAGLATNALNAVLGAFVPGFGALAAFGVSIASAVATELFIGLTEDDLDLVIEQLSDHEARDCVARDVYDSIIGTKPTQVSLKAAFDFAASSANPARVTIGEACSAALNSIGAFVEFLSMTAAFVQFAVDDLLVDDCADLCNYWEHTFDFTVGNGGFTQQPNFELGLPSVGTWVSGEGWKMTLNNGRPGSPYVDMRITKVISIPQLLSMEIEYGFTKGSGNGVLRLGDNSTFGLTQINPSATVSSAILKREFTEPRVCTDPIITFLACSGCSSGGGVVRYIKFTGNGSNPFI